MILTTFFELDLENIEDIYGSSVLFNIHKLNRRLATLMETAIINIYHVRENAEEYL